MFTLNLQLLLHCLIKVSLPSLSDLSIMVLLLSLNLLLLPILRIIGFLHLRNKPSCYIILLGAKKQWITPLQTTHDTSIAKVESICDIYIYNTKWLQDVQLLSLLYDTVTCRILEKEMATHSSILAWKIPWTEKFGRLVHGAARDSDTTERLKHCCFSLHNNILRPKYVIQIPCFGRTSRNIDFVSAISEVLDTVSSFNEKTNIIQE